MTKNARIKRSSKTIVDKNQTIDDLQQFPSAPIYCESNLMPILWIKRVNETPRTT